MTPDRATRQQLAAALAWKEAHAGFDAAVAGIPPEARGTRPANLPYSAWQLLEHLRISQHDILDFCLNAGYEERAWPDDYWPASPEPPDSSAWDESLRLYREDRAALQRLATDADIDLTSKIPHGDGQTYLREILLATDHAAYHVGELVVLRRLLGIWP
jgi:uncharacterized damage-inducible protein DinB